MFGDAGLDHFGEVGGERCQRAFLVFMAELVRSLDLALDGLAATR